MSTEKLDQEQLRFDRREQLLKDGIDVYPARSTRSQTVQQVLDKWSEGKSVAVAGRVRAIRIQGGSAFLRIEDESGEIQLFLQKKNLATFVDLTATLDLGDFLDVSGKTFVTKRGEKTIDLDKATWLGKALRPLPSEWHGLKDVETRYRYRELDLLSSVDVKKIFITRSTILTTIREFLVKHNFIEVETPMLQTLAGGATARPFVTHHNALDVDLFLRIAPELYLKRLMVGGLGRVFEIGRDFRNEGIDRDHNPEFTMMECYAAFTDYEWMMTFTEQLLVAVAKAVNGTPTITLGEKKYDLSKPFPRLTYHQAVLKATKIDIDTVDDKELRAQARKIGTDIPDGLARPKIIDELFKTHVRPTMIAPTIVYDYPADMIPLAKKKHNNPKYVECFQVLMNGTELAKAFSELNDPVDQRERFEAQEKMRAGGDDEAQRIDETYIRSLEYGMPPTSGLGIGIDRLTAIFTNQKSLKDVILFPTLKPEQS